MVAETAAAADQAAMSAALPGPVADTQPWWYVPAGFAVLILLAGSVVWWLVARQRRRVTATD